jgi:hypothetical protein
MIKVIRHSKGQRETGVYIGRPHEDFDWIGSALANPYVIGRDGTREQCVAAYKIWLWEHMWHDEWECQICGGEVRAMIKFIVDLSLRQDVALICFCVPLLCHGSVVKKACDWIVGGHYNKFTEKRK